MIGWWRLVFATTATTVAAMLSDRPYLRGDYQREKTSALTWLLSAIIAGFVLQVLLGASWMSGAGDRLENTLGLTIPAFQDGWIWTLVTHSFLHRPGFIFHIVGNCLALYFLGRELIPMLGTRRFLGLYAAATILSALAWTATHWRFGHGDLVGATSAVYALLVVFTCFAPNRPLNVLLFFFFPVTVKPKYLVAFLAGLDAFVFLVYEMPGVKMPLEMNIASSAHLAGLLTGLLYFRFIHNAAWFNPEDRPETVAPRWSKRATRAITASPALEAGAVLPPSSREDIRAEVDRILDKINSHGLSALTPDEKRLLDEAKDVLSRP